MFDQSFSAKNFQKIFDYENRRGVYLEGMFFKDLEKMSQDLKNKAKVSREIRKSKFQKGNEEYETELAKLRDEQVALKNKKHELLMVHLQEISREANDKTFSVDLKQNIQVQGKNVYSAGKSATAYFALKQLQYNIRRLYKVKQSDRYQIICQLRELLSDRVPKIILRTDFSDFYESIPTDKLLKQIADDSLLTRTSQKLIKRVLREFHNQTGNPTGVPRGIGLSAYLTELYMRRFDETFRDYPGVLYYSRYVDDVFIIFVPGLGHTFYDLQWSLIEQIYKYGLRRNRKKTKIQYALGSHSYSIDYLGYTFSYGNGNVDLSITQSKQDRYRGRIKRAFEDYDLTRSANEKQAKDLLVKRIRFLTSNTRLLNNKKKAAVGIYFTNSLITSTTSLNPVDKYLEKEIKNISDGKLKSYLREFTFKEGFEKKRFRKFTVAELKQIVQVWK